MTTRGENRIASMVAAVLLLVIAVLGTLAIANLPAANAWIFGVAMAIAGFVSSRIAPPRDVWSTVLLSVPMLPLGFVGLALAAVEGDGSLSAVVRNILPACAGLAGAWVGFAFAQLHRPSDVHRAKNERAQRT